MKVAIYVSNSQVPTSGIWNDGGKLDMFNDENLNIVSKLNDIEKLSNVFSDFSLSFTVPATPKNNSFFKNYYDLDIDNTFNANIRVDSIIEIDTFPFKYGQIQLESVQLKQQKIDNYKLTFYSKVSQLSDLFGNDLLSGLDYDLINNIKTKVRNNISDFDYPYTSANFINSINNAVFKNGDLITPLINFGNRDWNYGGGSSTTVADISIDTGAIKDIDLRPAIRLIRLIEAIEDKYNITFTKNFLNKATFQDLFLWCNGRKDSSLTQTQEATIDQTFTGTNNGYFTQVGNVLRVQRRKYTESIFSIHETSARFDVVPTNPSLSYSLVIQDEEGNQLARQDNVTGNRTIVKTFNAILGNNAATTELVTDTYKLVIISDFSNTFTIGINVQSFKLTDSTEVYVNVFSTSNVSVISVDLLLEDNLPKIKVIDLITNMMKMFKLIIRPITLNDFYLDTIDSFYSTGSILDITDFVDQSSVLITRPNIYNKIDFKFKKTNNITGRKFRELNSPIEEFGYGDEGANYPSVKIKNELKVEIGFDNMLFERLSNNDGEDTGISIGQALTSSDDITFNNNSDTIILFYNNGINNHNDFPIKIKFGADAIQSIIYSYILGNTNNEYTYQITDSINFGSEIDPWHGIEIPITLYSNCWRNWINTIYDLKQRKLTYEATLPTRYITELSLNDRLIIGNDRFKIEDYTINLVDGKTKLNLFKDIYQSSTPIVESLLPSDIVTNAGVKYYDCFITTNQSWTLSKVDTGDGVDWVDIIGDLTGTGSKLFTVRVGQKTNESAPSVYEARFMTIRLTLNDLTTKDIIVNQFGLVE